MRYLFLLLAISTISIFKAQSVSIVKSSDTSLELLFQFEPSQLMVKQFNHKDYIDFTQSSDLTLFEKGAPSLPFYSKSILLPSRGNSSLEVVYDDVIEYSGQEILPSLGLQKRKSITNDYVFGKIYSEDSFYPGKLATTTPPFLLRELRGQTIHLYPYQYNPIRKTLRFYKKLRVIITFNEKGHGINELLDPSVSHLGKQHFKHQFITPVTKKEKYFEKPDQGEMLVICPARFKQTIQPLVDWKNQKGILTRIEFIENIGDSSHLIKKYIVDYYKKHPSLLHLLLVGDHQDITPYSYGFYDSDVYWSDSYYGQISGDDLYSELFVGRFSGTVDEVKIMVQRTLEYEKNPAAGDWMNKAIGIASSQGLTIGDNGESDWQHERLIRTSLLASGYSSVYEFYDGDQGGSDEPGNPSSTAIVKAINSGVGLLNYTGHGDTDNFISGNFHASDVLAAENYGKYPFVVSVACNNGKFVNSTCLSETWLSATHNNQITGAIAMCGSSILMDWAPPMKTQDEIVRLLIDPNPTVRKTSLGGLFNNGQFSMLEKYGIVGNGVVQTWVFFGDPSTVIRTQITKPIAFTVVKNSGDSLNDYVVHSEINGLNIGISKNNTYITSGTIINNNYTFSLPPSEISDTFLVTATLQNYATQQQIIVKEKSVKLDEQPVSTLNLYPNPSNNIVYIASSGPFEVDIVTLEGKKITTYVHSQPEVFSLDVSSYLTGSYLFVFKINDQIITRKIEIIKQ